MGHYWVTIREERKKGKALRPSLFQYKSSDFVPETKDGLIARRERQELTDLHPAPLCAFLNEGPSFQRERRKGPLAISGILLLILIDSLAHL